MLGRILFALLLALVATLPVTAQISRKPSRSMRTRRHTRSPTSGSRCLAPAGRFSACATPIAQDLHAVHQITGFQYVRFHGILNDDVGIYGEDKHGNPVYNFSYVDQIYDGLLADDVKPFVEISFMP